MPIDPHFPKTLQTIGKHELSDGEHFHIVWGPGKLADAAENEEVKKAYADRGEEIAPLGIHGTMVAVDWDVCIADGSCLDSCPVQVFEWYRTAADVPAKDVLTTKSSGSGATKKDDRHDYTDKSDPIREDTCIWCMACENVCPVLAIKVNQANTEYHQKASASV